MGVKLGKSAFPTGHGPSDFKCFGPPATKDGEFDNCKIADLGCFTQDGKDSNKLYHGAICKSSKNSKWFVYFEWGRTRDENNSNQYQFIECTDEADAQEEFSSQLLSKNLKRGTWETVAGVKVLRPRVSKKTGKADDLYVVRTMATRNVGLPDGKTISHNEGAKVAKSASIAAPAIGKSAAQSVDSQTISLMQDLKVGTVAYARTSLVGGAIPAQSAIDEARLFLSEAQKRVGKLGSATVDQQVADRELRDITSLVYSRIPKVKPIGAPDATWILSGGNILAWQNDLDAFEQALYSNQHVVQTVSDPFDGMAMDMSWVDPSSDLGKFLYSWWPNATLNRHSYLGGMKIKNAWRVDRHDDKNKIEKYMMGIFPECKGCKERPIKQPKSRDDLTAQGFTDAQVKMFKDTNTSLLFHGTRSVNVPGIMRTSFRFPSELVGVVITGAMFGPGVYFADDWKKSAGYTSLSGGYYSSGSGGVKGRGAFMFACDTVLGEPQVAPGPRGYTGTDKGKHCIFGKAGHSGVQNNEWITFQKQSTRLRYLVEFTV